MPVITSSAAARLLARFALSAAVHVALGLGVAAPHPALAGQTAAEPRTAQTAPAAPGSGGTGASDGQDQSPSLPAAGSVGPGWG
jgi:hypothetical protein